MQLSMASDANLWRSLVKHVALAATLVTATAPLKTNATLREAATKKETTAAPRFARLPPGKNVEAVAPECRAEDSRVDGGLVEGAGSFGAALRVMR